MKTIAGETVLKYLQDFPAHPSKTIARILTEREPVLFPDVEKARRIVRYYRGNSGAINRKHSTKEHHRTNGTQRDSLELLPDPIVELDPWKVEPISFKNALLLPDAHIPFHNKPGISIAVDYGRKRNVDCVILTGDLMDFYACSHFERDPRLRNLERELECGKAFLEWLRDRFPKAQIIYLEGNHEERLWRWAWARCPELYGVRGVDGRAMVNLRGLMDCDEYGVRVVDGRRPLKAGTKLHILHGHEYGPQMQSPVNPARGLYMRAKANAICGHHHQKSEHSEPSLDANVSCWSMGCLCGLHPAYAPLNKWSTGFSTVEMDRADWSVENKKIINGSIV